MTKLVLAALAAVTLTSLSIAPALSGIAYPTPTNGGGDQASGDEHSCFDQLGHMRRVFPAEVLGVDNGYRVSVTEFCPTSDLMRSDGNGSYLSPAIAENPVLVAALQGKGYHVDDVFAVKMMGDDAVGIFVHRFGS